MKHKNDVACVIDLSIALFEQQSTPNPNMPLRGFLYLSKLYQKMFGHHTDLYSSKKILLPTPQFVIFYNGTEDEPDRKEMRLSDAFVGEAGYGSCLECTATLININYGRNTELMERCESLKGYAILISRIRENITVGMEKEESIDKAVKDCISDGILKDILEAHRGETKDMLLEEYDEELHIRNEKQISYEDGREEGREEGIKEGIKEGRKEDMIDALASLVNDGILEITEAASRVGISSGEFKRWMNPA